APRHAGADLAASEGHDRALGRRRGATRARRRAPALLPRDRRCTGGRRPHGAHGAAHGPGAEAPRPPARSTPADAPHAALSAAHGLSSLRGCRTWVYRSAILSEP